MLKLIIAAAIGTVFITFLRMIIARRIEHVGIDVHKSHRPKVPESGGLSLRLITSLFSFYLAYTRKDETLLFLSIPIFLLGIIGLIDDFVELRPKAKFLATLLAGIPGAFSGLSILYLPRCKTSVASLYKLGIPVGYSVYANAVNMIDSVNTVAVFGTSLILSIQAIFLKLLGYERAFRLDILFLAILLSYLPFNLYPAHVFNGDVGDMTMGAMILTVALYSHLELVALILSIPILTNGMIFLLSYGLKTRKEFSNPTRFVEGKIVANEDPNAPRTLVWSLASLSKGLTEKDLIKLYAFFYIISALLASMLLVMYV